MKYFKGILAPSENPDSLGYAFRNKRFHIFEQLINQNFPKDKTIKVLDVGGTAYFWQDRDIVRSGRLQITLLNLQAESNLPKGINSLVGDAKQYLEEIRLINKSEMRKLFPGAKIYKEKMLGMTKSFTAHNLD